MASFPSSRERSNAAQIAREIAGIVKRDREIILLRVELDLATKHDLLEKRHTAFDVDVQVAKQDPVPNRDHGFVLVPAFSRQNLVSLQLLGGTRMF